MTTNSHIMTREDYILPSILPVDYNYRVSYHSSDGTMTWRWFKTKKAAEQWLEEVEGFE